MMRKKILSGIFSLFCFFSSFFPTLAQTNFTNILAQNVNADGAIVEISLPMNLDSKIYVLIAWQTADGQQTYVAQIAKGGTQIYDVRSHPLWHGQLKIVATNVNEAKGTVRPVTIIDEIKIFLGQERIMPYTINMLDRNKLFTWSWDTILLILMAISALFFFLATKNGVVVALVAGFVVAWTAMDLKKIADHWTIAAHMESQKLTVPSILQELKTFLDEASKIIGDKTWKAEGLGVLHLHLAEYSLADRKYALREPSQNPADFIITMTPKNREIFWNSGGYFLVKGTKAP
ncbi:MAG: hypothetical protein HQM13_23485 [SAR324 cluster bacterium]|nr:hypothetical protein [SAR324 cluster bacterium]